MCFLPLLGRRKGLQIKTAELLGIQQQQGKLHKASS